MFAMIGALLFLGIAIMTVLVGLGLPLGEFTMGGQYKVLPKGYRVMALLSLLIQIFAMLIILQAGGILPLYFSVKAAASICYFFSAYLTLNTIMNVSSKSKKERYVMTPLSLLAAICFLMTALSL